MAGIFAVRQGRGHCTRVEVETGDRLNGHMLCSEAIRQRNCDPFPVPGSLQKLSMDVIRDCFALRARRLSTTSYVIFHHRPRQ